MSTYIWLLPVIFMFHDMEEIVGAEKWIRNNLDPIIAMHPGAERLLKVYRGVTTAGFAAAVYEELIVLIVICCSADFTDVTFFDGLWFGGLVGFTLHLVIHIAQATLIRRYIPCLITSVISLPPSIYLISQCVPLLTFDALLISGMIVGIVGVALNLRFAHRIMLHISGSKDCHSTPHAVR